MTSASLFFTNHDGALARQSAGTQLTPQILLHAFPFPCVLFDSSGGLFLSNLHFQKLSPRLCTITHVNALLEHFDFFGQWPHPAPDTVAASYPARAFAPLTGKTYALQWSSASMTDRTEFLLLCIHDLSNEQQCLIRQRDMHEQLLHSARAQSVGEMTTILSHELNQPLGSIINYLDAARKMLNGIGQIPPRAHEALRFAQIQASQAAAVVARIREFVASREPCLEPYNIHTLISHGIELMQWEIQQSRVRLLTEIPGDLPTVHIDPVMVGQVFINLIQNGIDAMKDNPPILRTLTISAALDLDQRIVVRVNDSGPGISTDLQEKVFTPFFTTKPKGMGIGLAICRSIMEFHAGSLYFETLPQRGSTFFFTLPT